MANFKLKRYNDKATTGAVVQLLNHSGSLTESPHLNKLDLWQRIWNLKLLLNFELEVVATVMEAVAAVRS